MYTLGLNIGHDASAALLHNGSIIGAIEEEKLSRIKKDNGWPRLAIQFLLKNQDIAPNVVDHIAIGGALDYRDLGLNEIKFRFQKQKVHKYKEYVNRVVNHYIPGNEETDHDDKKNLIIELIRKEGFNKAQISFWDHHLSHAASAYYCAPIDIDLIYTSDGRGDDVSSAFFKVDEAGDVNYLHKNLFHASVGAFYSIITELLGFKPNRHEGKITGLAAYGQPTQLLEDFRALFSTNADGTLKRYPFVQTTKELEKKWSEQESTRDVNWASKVNLSAQSEIGHFYNKTYLLLKEKVRASTEKFSKEDIAYACQKVAEEVSLSQLDTAFTKYDLPEKVSVGLAGGVFANVRINQLIYEHPRVKNVFVQPAMGDNGMALGAAILCERQFLSNGDYRFENTYLGPDYGDLVSEIKKDLGDSFTMIKLKEPAKEIAHLLNNNVIIGFWHGSMEWGPRALGRRSIILNTFNKEVNKSLNDRLSRTEFMPFAPSVVDYCAKEYFPNYSPEIPAADYMTITYDTEPKYHELLQATVHVDGTARPQIVKKETNPYYYAIIDEFYKISNCGAIVNTSFNAHEEPIVSTPLVALKALKENRVDCLVLDNYFVAPIDSEVLKIYNSTSQISA